MNDVDFLRWVTAFLATRGIETWIFGGWGEELRGLIRPRDHVDVDLLYPAESWHQVDGLDLKFVEGKRFPWKRAFVLDGVTVELFLVRRDEQGWYTDLRRRRHRWPTNVFSSTGLLPVASTAALASYRHSYRIDAA